MRENAVPQNTARRVVLFVAKQDAFFSDPVQCQHNKNHQKQHSCHLEGVIFLIGKGNRHQIKKGHMKSVKRKTAIGKVTCDAIHRLRNLLTSPIFHQLIRHKNMNCDEQTDDVINKISSREKQGGLACQSP